MLPPAPSVPNNSSHLMGIHFVPGVLLGPCMLTMTLGGRHGYYSLVTDQETQQ